MPEKIKVLFIHQDGLITGSAISLYNLLGGLKNLGVDPVLMLAGDGPAKGYFETLQIPVHIVPMHGFWTAPGPKWYQRGAWKNYPALLKNKSVFDFVSNLKPDIVHINDKAALSAGLSIRSMNIPIVQHLRSSYFTCRFPLFKWVSIFCIRNYSHYLIAISEDEIDGFEKFPRLRIVYNSVNLEEAQHAIENREATRKAYGIGSNEYLIGYVGIFSRIRGAFDFMHVCKSLLKREPTLPFKFLMLGNLPQRMNLSKGLFSSFRSRKSESDKFFQLKHELNDQVITPGYSSEPLRIMAAMDLLVITSHLGVLGRQPLEAQSVGVPVAAYNGHSRQSKVVTGKTGIVINETNPEILASEIHNLLMNKEHLARMATNALAYSRHQFDPAGNAVAVLGVYQEILGSLRIKR